MNALRSTLLLCWLGLASPLLAADVITNVMSPVVSYQYFNDLGSEALTNGGVMSPVASYQYFDSLGTNVTYQQSPQVSYFFNVPNGGNAYTLTGRVLDAAGGPVTGATVTAAVLETIQSSATTATDGSYQIPALPQGVYVFSAAKAGYARSRRVVSFEAGSIRQEFRLVPVVTPPVVQDAGATPPPFLTAAPADLQGSRLEVFNGTQFVPDTTPTLLNPAKMTVVMAHGWKSSPTEWALPLAVALKDKGVASQVNIVAWNWQPAAVAFLPPEEATPKQGLALGQALYQKLGSGYATNLHFLGHSLGTLVNAAAANYLHGHARGKQERASPAWISSRTHMTLFDEAELARVVGKEVLFDIVGGFLQGNGVRIALAAGETLAGWKTPVPVESAWVDSYISLVGIYHADALNVSLQKAIPLTASFAEAHSYPQRWYSASVARPTVAPVGFRRTFEYRLLPEGAQAVFPPAPGELPLGDAYRQVDSATDELALEQLPNSRIHELLFPVVGVTAEIAADFVLDGVEAGALKVGTVTVEVVDAVGTSIGRAVDTVVNGTLNAGQRVIDLLNRPSLRISMQTGLGGLVGQQLRPADVGSGNTPAYIWLPVVVPTNAAAMAFDFTITGDGKQDSLVFGVNSSNLFALELKFVAEGETSTSRLIDVSAYAGATNDFFFGVVGGTSTNCAAQIQNIKFFTLALPQLAISQSSGTTTVSWSSTLTGFNLETSASLAPPNWQPVTNSPTLYGGTMTVTNIPSERANFFRLRKL